MSFIILMMLFSCSPQSSPPASQGEVLPGEAKDEGEVGQLAEIPEGCETFESARLGETALENFVIYRGFLREREFEDAFAYWQQVYEIAPAADGRRWTVFSDGIWFYENLLREEEDLGKRDEYIRMILKLYDQIGLCYPEQLEYTSARKAFDLYYYYRDFAEDKEIFDLFSRALNYFGEETPAFVVNPFTALLVQKTLDELIEIDRSRVYAQTILQLVALHDDPGDEGWNIVRNYAPLRLADLERIEGFFDCEYYRKNYLPLFEESPEDCQTIQLVLGKLIWGDCSEDMDIMAELRAASAEHCVAPVTASTLVRDAYSALRDGNFKEAADFFKKAIEEQDDRMLKADYALVVGKIYYSHLRNFPQARTYAQKAIEFRPGWGEPHILIGKLYASSGPLCGPGTGWDSQVVTWVAIDEWERARSKDPQVRNEATNLINTYRQYMPSVEDIFQRGLQEGQRYFVPCWIQRETTIRAKR